MIRGNSNANASNFGNDNSGTIGDGNTSGPFAASQGNNANVTIYMNGISNFLICCCPNDEL
jgi:hypothetical protein